VTMAPTPADDDDDLDAFFDDVEKVAEEVEEEVVAGEKDPSSVEPPNKKQKTTSVAPPVRPHGVVVAAASSASYKKKEPEHEETATTGNSNGPSDQVMVGPSFPPSHNPAAPYSHRNNHAASMSGGGVIGPQAPQETAEQAKKPTHTNVRTAGGKTWVDTSLDDWPDDDFRIFVGNLGNDVNDVMLYQHFSKYSSLQRAKVVRDSKMQSKNNNQDQQQQHQQNHYQPPPQQQNNNNKKSDSKGYGFVSFGDALECARAIREMDQTWLGSRPVRIKRSTWKDRDVKQVRKQQKNKKNHQRKMGLL